MSNIKNKDIFITRLYKVSIPNGYEIRVFECLKKEFKVTKASDGDFTFIRLELKNNKTKGRLS
jgi:hypothetical protein